MFKPVWAEKSRIASPKGWSRNSTTSNFLPAMPCWAAGAGVACVAGPAGIGSGAAGLLSGSASSLSMLVEAAEGSAARQR